jgi:nickel-dependent lactate racemase
MENHFLAVSFPGNLLGRELTSIRENMEGVVEKIGLDYILNVVMTPYGEVIDVMGGHFVAAQRAAVRAAQTIYSVPFSQRVDVVVSNAYPAEIDFWQASKGIWAGDLMVKPGGTLVLNAPCPEGLGMHPEYMYWSSCKPKEIIEAVRTGKLTDKNLAGGAVEVATILEHLKLAIVSEGITVDQVEACGFVSYPSLQAAIDDALRQAGPEAMVGVITHGGYTFPTMTEDTAH